MTGKRRVLLLIKGLGVGGAEQLLVNSLPYLDRSTFEYHAAYVLPWKDDNVPHFKAHDVPVHCLQGGNPLDLRVLRRVRRLLEELRIDILDVHLPYSGVLGRLAARRARTPVVVYTEHSLAVQRQWKNLHFVSFVANILTYGMNDMILTVSRDLLLEVEHFALGRVPVRLIYNGIPLERFDREGHSLDRSSLGIPRHHKVVGHVATFTSKKRQDILLKAAKTVIDAQPNVNFVLVGKGPLRPQLEQLANDLHIRDNVVFAGFLSSPVDVMSTFDVLALSSQYEGLPTVAIEAMALGVPVVSTWVGGTPEIVNDGYDGLLVPPGDPSQLARSLLRLLRDDGLRADMGKRAEASVRSKFDIRRRVREVEHVYLELLGDAAQASPLSSPDT